MMGDEHDDDDDDDDEEHEQSLELDTMTMTSVTHTHTHVCIRMHMLDRSSLTFRTLRRSCELFDYSSALDCMRA